MAVVESGSSFEAWACDSDHVHVEHTLKSGKVESRLIFANPDEAYEYAQAILRAYDDAVGIAAPK